MGVVGEAGQAVWTRAGGVVTTVTKVLPTIPAETLDRYTRLTFPVSSFVYKRVKNLWRRQRENKDLALVSQQQQQLQQLTGSQQLQQVIAVFIEIIAYPFF